MGKGTEVIVNYLSQVTTALEKVNPIQIYNAVYLLREIRDKQGTVWLVGNGGSAATTSHFANDLMKMGGVKAISLSDMTPIILAYGNDHDWRHMFYMPLVNLKRPDDALVAISCSGKSRNVIDASFAFDFQHLIVLTGNPIDSNEIYYRGAAAMICVEAEDIRVQEDVHLSVCHAIAGMLGNDRKS